MRALSAPLLALALQQAPAAHQARVAWVPNPRTTGGTWVSDAGRHLRLGTVDSVNAVIGALEAATSAEIAVVVVDSLSGLTEQEFALAVHRTWGVGKQGADNGVLLLWAPNDRAVFLSIGYGLEGAIPDRLAGRIRDQEIIAAFRENDFDRGITQGVAALAAAIQEEHASGAPARVRSGDRSSSGGGLWGALLDLLGSILKLAAPILAGVGAIIGSVFGVRRWRRRRPRPCPKCGTRMTLLGEEADDARLDEGARAEEKVKSINWDVWVCPSCDETMRVPFKTFLSSYFECPQCKRRTAQAGGRKQVRAPTTTSTGLAEVRNRCANCQFAWTATETIARLSSSSGSSSSSGWSGGSSGGGGSSFGGGSAGGGGAGGRY
jgi:uncharacterized protein